MSQPKTPEEQVEEYRSEVVSLKEDIAKWKDAWFHLRELIGRMAWEHLNCPHNRHSEPPPLPSSQDYAVGECVRVQTRAYQRIANGWRQIAECASNEAAEAVIRLMTMEGRKINE